MGVVVVAIVVVVAVAVVVTRFLLWLLLPLWLLVFHVLLCAFTVDGSMMIVASFDTIAQQQ